MFLQCSKPNDESAYGSVISEVRTRAVPGGMDGLQLALHYICGGDSAAACSLSVEVEERSATSHSRQNVWSLPDSDKAIGASALSNSTWSHQIINIPRIETESQLIIRTEYNYLEGGGLGLDNKHGFTRNTEEGFIVKHVVRFFSSDGVFGIPQESWRGLLA